MDELHLVPLRLITSTITLIDEALTHIGFPVDHIAWALTSIDHPCELIGNPVPSITLVLERNALPIM